MKISLKSFWRRGSESGNGAGAALLGAGALRWLRPTQAPAVEPDSALEWPDTQPHQHSEHAQAIYGATLQALAARPQESLALSIRLPFCAAHCLFCDRDIHAAQPSDAIGRYVEALASEVALLAQHVGGGRDVLQLHLGGGSANEMSEPQLIRLVETLRSAWRLPADAEMSVECDPRRVTRQHLDTLQGLGFRHVTFGVGDLDSTVQQAIGRCNSPALIDDVCTTAREVGFERIRLELLIGLPGQSESSWRSTLARLVAIGPHRVALSDYRHQPYLWPAQQAIDHDALPDPGLCDALRSLSRQALQAAGYTAIDDQLCVLDDDELALAQPVGKLRRTLLGPTATPEVPLLGLGAGAIGEIDGTRFWNLSALRDWHAALQSQQLPVARAQGSRTAAALRAGDSNGAAPRWLS